MCVWRVEGGGRFDKVIHCAGRVWPIPDHMYEPLPLNTSSAIHRVMQVAKYQGLSHSRWTCLVSFPDHLIWSWNESDYLLTFSR